MESRRVFFVAQLLTSMDTLVSRPFTQKLLVHEIHDLQLLGINSSLSMTCLVHLHKGLIPVFQVPSGQIIATFS